MKVLVYGSANIDRTYRVSHFVGSGETMSAVSDYLARIVLDALNFDVSTEDAAAAKLRHTYLTGREDRDDSYLLQFKTFQTAPSRVIWDVSAIAFLKNPAWTPSTLEYSPVFKDDLSWGETDETRHKIRVVNYCLRDLIFGDMIQCLTK